MIREHIEKIVTSLRRFIYNPNNTTLDSYQLAFIIENLCNSKLYGVPGGGKTTCIIHKILYHHHCGIDLRNSINNNNEFLVLMFNKDARFNFIKKGNQIANYKNFFNKNNVRTFHSLAGSIHYHSSNPDKHKSEIDTTIFLSYNLIVKKQIDLYNIPCLINCKVIFVDEAQDMTEYQYKLVKIIADILSIPLILIGDPNQSIYQFGGSINKYFKEYKGPCFKLYYNYRSTKNIIDFTNYFIPDIPTKILSNKNKIGKKPSIVIDNINSTLRYIINEITTYKNDISNIAIIGPVKKSHPSLDDGKYGNIGLQLISNFLTENGIKFVKRYKLGQELDYVRVNSVKKGHVNLLTIHTAKGLEFEKVILINFHYETFGGIPTKEEYQVFKYMWYVGISRTINELIIYVDLEKTIWPMLENCPKYLYMCNIQNIFFKDIVVNNYSLSYVSVKDFTERLTDNELFIFDDKIKLSIKEEIIFNISEKELPYDDEYSVLNGKFIESVFFYYIHLINESIDKFVEYMRTRVNNIYEIKKKDLKGVVKLKTYIGRRGIIYPKMYEDVNNGKIIDTDIVNFIKKIYSNCKKNKSIKLVSKNNVMYINKKMANNLCNDIHINPLDSIFYLELYLFNIQEEAYDVWNMNHSKKLEELKKYAESILYNNIKHNEDIQKIILNKFYAQCECNLIIEETTISGTIDLLTEHEIIEIKYTKDITSKIFFQILLYYSSLLQKMKIPKQLNIYNLRTGIKYIIDIISPIEEIIETIKTILINIKDRR